MNCNSVRENIKAYIDDELSARVRQRMERHLANCPGCREEEGAVRELTEKVKSAAGLQAPAGLRERVLRGIEFKPQQRGSRRWRWAPVAVVGMAVVVVAVIVGPVTQKAQQSARTTAAGENDHMKGLPYMAESPTATPAVSAPRAKMAKPYSNDAREVLRHRAADSVSVPTANPIVIKTAELSVKVKRFQLAYNEAVRIANGCGGYVTNSSSATEGTAPTSGSVTLRVPDEQFERVVERLSKLGTVKSQSVDGQDVTGEVVDLDSRLRNKRAEERQYLEIMNRAKRVPDIVTVTEQLSSVRGEIEEIQGRLKYLRSAAAMSTINLNLWEAERPKPKPQSGVGKSFGSAVASLKGTLSGLASVVIWIAVYSPFWALPLGAFAYIRRKPTQ